jgi:hypothetical protein
MHHLCAIQVNNSIMMSKIKFLRAHVFGKSFPQNGDELKQSKILYTTSPFYIKVVSQSVTYKG